MKMTLKDKIYAYAKCGGAWIHLESELINSGLSKKFTDCFISHFKMNLCQDNAEKALAVYDLWKRTNNEEQAYNFLLLIKF